MISESALDDLINIAEENARKYGFDSLAKNCQASRTELAAMRARIAELEAQADTLTPRRCSRECYLRGLQAAQEAAANEVRSLSRMNSAYEDSIRYMQPPADCGCNPLKPDNS